MCFIKGTVSRDFRPLVFFHESITINGLKYFCIWLKIRRKISENVLTPSHAALRGVTTPHYALPTAWRGVGKKILT
jgi:hypothetical protein